jgi:hypothetical protein
MSSRLLSQNDAVVEARAVDFFQTFGALAASKSQAIRQLSGK